MYTKQAAGARNKMLPSNTLGKRKPVTTNAVTGKQSLDSMQQGSSTQAVKVASKTFIVKLAAEIKRAAYKQKMRIAIKKAFHKVAAGYGEGELPPDIAQTLQQDRAESLSGFQNQPSYDQLKIMQNSGLQTPGPMLGMHPGMLGALGAGAGALGGYLGSDEEDKMRNMLLMGLLGAGAGYGIPAMYNSYQAGQHAPAGEQVINQYHDNREAGVRNFGSAMDVANGGSKGNVMGSISNAVRGAIPTVQGYGQQGLSSAKNVMQRLNPLAAFMRGGKADPSSSASPGQPPHPLTRTGDATPVAQQPYNLPDNAAPQVGPPAALPYSNIHNEFMTPTQQQGPYRNPPG